MGIQTIISFFGGIALFLFGIALMGNGLKKVAGDKLETFLYKLTSNAFKGMLLGVGVTMMEVRCHSTCGPDLSFFRI